MAKKPAYTFALNSIKAVSLPLFPPISNLLPDFYILDWTLVRVCKLLQQNIFEIVIMIIYATLPYFHILYTSDEVLICFLKKVSIVCNTHNAAVHIKCCPTL